MASGNTNPTRTNPIGKPGYTGNPNGRPKTPESVKLAFSGMMPLALAAMRAVLDGSDESAKASDRIKAADIVFDRNLGKPVQQVDANVNADVRTIDTSKLTKEQRDAVAAIAISTMGLDDHQ